MGNCMSCLKLEKSEKSPTQTSVSVQLVSQQPGCQELHGESVTPDSGDKVQPARESINIKENKMPVMKYLPRMPSLPKEKKAKDLSESKMTALFDAYKNSDNDCIMSDGICGLCEDLEIDPDDFRVLVFAWKCNASVMGQFSRQEFMTGLTAIECDSIKSIQTRFPELLAELSDNAEFKKLYRFVYKFAASGQKITSEVAIILWNLVFSQNIPAILPKWIEFLQCHPSINYITEDTWTMFLTFVESVSDDLGSYDENEAWPSLFDDFVEFQNDQTNQNISKEYILHN